jgi:hypothetical protein
LINGGDEAVDLEGWRLNAGTESQNFTFPAFVLQPGEMCRVYTNEDHPEYGGLSFQRGNAVWKNGGDCGTLYDVHGNKVHEYCY